MHVPELDCPTELGLIEAGLQPIRGVKQLRPDYLARTLRVEHEPSVDPTTILAALADAGFPATLRRSEQEEIPPSRRFLMPITLWIAVGLLVLALSGWLAMLESTWVAVLAVSAMLLAGFPVAKNAWRAFCLRHLDMNSLLTIASIGAVLTGEWLEAATGMVLFRISLLIDEGSKRKAHQSIRALMNSTPATAHRLATDGSQELTQIPVEELHVGQMIRVLPGERVPVDGRVISGASSVNEANVTGESMPVTKELGADLYGGSLNGEGSLDVEVLRSATDSTPARITRLIEDAQARRSPMERFVDRFARIYTPVVIGLALLLALCPLFIKLLAPDALSFLGQGNFGEVWTTWFHRALVMLVIACPCALVLSTPITIVCGLCHASRRGILVKGGEFLEAMGQVRQIALDKTGTVTEGEPQVVDVQVFADLSKQAVLNYAAALERHSEHPLARAITTAAIQTGEEGVLADQFEPLRGYGIRGVIEGLEYIVASPRYCQTLGIEDPISDSADPSATRVFVVRETELLGAISLRDQPRQNASESIADWRRLGVEKIVLLTGDRSAVATHVANTLGLNDHHADLLPADKIAWIDDAAKHDSRLVMVGDGVNDAPALARAPIGIAFGESASDTVLETSDVVIMSPNLAKISSLIRTSRKTRTILLQNIVLAFGVKLVVLLLATAGQATMWMAVAADVGASLMVIGNGTRLLRAPESAKESITEAG